MLLELIPVAEQRLDMRVATSMMIDTEARSALERGIMMAFGTISSLPPAITLGFTVGKNYADANHIFVEQAPNALGNEVTAT